MKVSSPDIRGERLLLISSRFRAAERPVYEPPAMKTLMGEGALEGIEPIFNMGEQPNSRREE